MQHSRHLEALDARDEPFRCVMSWDLNVLWMTNMGDMVHSRFGKEAKILLYSGAARSILLPTGIVGPKANDDLDFEERQYGRRASRSHRCS